MRLALDLVVRLPQRDPRVGLRSSGRLSRLACVAFCVFLFLVPIRAGEVNPLFKVTVDQDFPEAKATVEEIIALVLKEYYTDQIDEKSLWWGAVEGVLRRISPEENKALAAFWPAEDYKAVDQALRGVKESIGIKSSYNPGDGSLTVTEVLAGGPSESLLFPYDRIVRIDGTPLKGLGVSEVDALLKGEVGTRVSLKVVRDVMIFDLIVNREAVKIENVASQLLTDDIAYVSVLRFSAGVTDRVKEQLESFRSQNVRGLVLDVRGNSGGVFAEALKSAELFIPKGKSLMRMVSHGNKVNNYVSANEDVFGLPLVVLINEQSASASEIVAAALRDEAGAFLVGTKSYGKATMEKAYTLNNKFHVRFTNAALYSPKGRSWQKTGLLPDFPVTQSAEVLKQTRGLASAARLARDQQLHAACRLLTAGR